MKTRVFVPGDRGLAQSPPACVVCCTPVGCRSKWLSTELAQLDRQWYFYHDEPKAPRARWQRSRRLAAIRASWQAIATAKRHHADLLITGRANLTFWCAFFALVQRVHVTHFAVSFHLRQLPRGLNFLWAQWVYGTVQKLIIHSRAERQLYSEYFGIPPGRFEMQHAAGDLPTYAPDYPLEAADYICAIARSPQDFATLLAAIAHLPHIPLVIATPYHHWLGPRRPPNVKLHTRCSTATMMNLLKFSRFLVMPLHPHQDLCDYGLLVAAMQLGKAIVTTDSLAVSDYAFQDSNAVLYPARNVAALTHSLAELWRDVLKSEVLGQNGQEYAQAFCSQASTRKYYQRLLARHGI